MGGCPGADTLVFSQADSGHDEAWGFNAEVEWKGRFNIKSARTDDGDAIVFRSAAVSQGFDDLTLTGKRDHTSDTTPGTLNTRGAHDGTNSIFPEDMPPQLLREEDFICA